MIDMCFEARSLLMPDGRTPPAPIETRGGQTAASGPGGAGETGLLLPHSGAAMLLAALPRRPTWTGRGLSS